MFFLCVISLVPSGFGPYSAVLTTYVSQFKESLRLRAKLIRINRLFISGEYLQTYDVVRRACWRLGQQVFF